MKLSPEQTTTVAKTLARLDRIANVIEARRKEWKLPAKDAAALLAHLDGTADELQLGMLGAGSLEATKQRVAKVIQRESDEAYMETFNAPSKPHQTDGDEGYMNAYAGDDTAGVQDGKSTNGKPLNPGA